MQVVRCDSGYKKALLINLEAHWPMYGPDITMYGHQFTESQWLKRLAFFFFFYSSGYRSD